MEDWNKIRKSDEEFIKGIYDKANKYQEQERINRKNNVKPYDFEKKSNHNVVPAKWISWGLSAVAACALVVVGAARWFPMVNKKDSADGVNKAMYRALEEQGDDIENDITSQPQEEEPIRVFGIIDNIEASPKGYLMDVRIDQEDQNEIEKTIQVVLSDALYEKMEQYKAENGIDSLIGKRTQMDLIHFNYQEYYKVDTDTSFYLEENDEEGQSIYINMNGEQYNGI